MALIKCPCCGHTVSDKAESCPHCGHPIRQNTVAPNARSHKQSGLTWLWVVLALIAFTGIGAYWWLSSTPKQEGQVTQTKSTEIAIDTIVAQDSIQTVEKPVKPKDTTSKNPFIGKTFYGGGNTGGMGIEMLIEFISDTECVCESNWYNSEPPMTPAKATYTVEGKHLRVVVSDGSFAGKEFNFTISNDGKTISYDNSKPDHGTAGNDYMNLELK